MLVGLDRMTSDLVEAVLGRERDLRGRVLVVTSGEETMPLDATPDVTVVRIATSSGRALAYRLEPEPTDLGELTPDLLRTLACGTNE